MDIKNQVQPREHIMNKFKFFINNVDYTKRTPFPIKWAEHLDERLNEGRVTIKHIPVQHFPMFSKVRFELLSKRGETLVKNFLLASDDSLEIINAGVYNHEITLIEETKLLERTVVDSITFTNDLGRNYTGSQYVANFSVASPQYFNLPTVYTPQQVGDTFTLPAPNDVIIVIEGVSVLSRKLIVTYGTEIYEVSDNQSFSVKLKPGQYYIEYEGVFEVRGSKFTVIATASISSAQNYDPLPRWTITEVINRVLEVAETKIKGVAPKYKLNAEQAEEFSKIEAPEFAFTRSTLKEVLDQIGGFIHGIPRLEGDTIYYDMLGGIELADLSGIGYVSKVISQNVEDYATQMDCTLENLVSIVDRSQGTVKEPYSNGFKTVRTEQLYARIEEGNMVIETDFPIQDIVSVECGLLPTAPTVKGGDLTPYVFEEADYARLSSYDENYPTSRAYAIYFTQGQKNIKGLGFKIQDATGGVFARYAIANIIQAASGEDIGKAWSADNYPRLAFRVSYIPIFSSRLQQNKMYVEKDSIPSTLIFNQGANLIETRYVGENIKGAIARTGNEGKQITYITSYLNKIPKIGQLFDEEYYISSVAVEYLQNYFYMTLDLSKDFNRLSQYIGINSQRRYYEVSEKQAYNREVLYTDYCVVGDPVEADTTLVKDNAIEYIRRTFLQKQDGADYQSISNVYAVGHNDEGGDLTYTILPAISTAFGNAMVFGFRYADNYSAGNKASKSNNGAVSGYFTQSVPYADYYGRFDNLKFDFANGGPTASDIDSQTNIGTLVPQWVVFAEGLFFSTGDNHPLVVKKDGRETLSMNYQLEFVTNRKSILIGSALCRDCPLTSGIKETAQYASLYVFPKRLSKFADKVDLSAGTKVLDFTNDSYLTQSGQSLVFASQTANADGQSWAIVNSTTGELYIGENIAVTNGQALNLPTMTFKHNIYQ